MVAVAVAVSVGAWVAVGGMLVLVGAAVVLVGVSVKLPTTMMTYTSSPKNCPTVVCMRQLPRMAPVLFVGATMAIEMSISVLTGTAEGSV